MLEKSRVKRWLLVLAALTVAAAVWLLLRTPSEGPAASATATASPPPATKSASNPGRRPDKPEAPPRVSKKKTVTKAERDAIRQRIVDGIEARKRAAPPPPSEAPADQPDDRERSGGSGGIKDRTGGALSGFIATINDDFMPLAEECYEQALEEDPNLRGMLDVNVEVLADEDVGGMVDSVELGAENEIHSASMTECIRETMLSTVFPPPGDSGHSAVRLTLRFEPEEPAAD